MHTSLQFRQRPRVLISAGLMLFAVNVASLAQEPINAFDSATQPSPGHVIFREQFRYNRFDLNTGPLERRGKIEDATLFTTLNVGITSDVALSLRAPVIFREREFDRTDRVDRDQGVGDVLALAKLRIYRNDTGPLDSARFSLIGGMDIRTGDAPFTSDAYSPVIGLAYTQIIGRHGFNGSLQWTFTTAGNDEPLRPGESTADVCRYDAAYLFRLHPRQYAADTHGALYAVVELNGIYETNGDHEVFIAPGLMYEAQKWTAELSLQLPAFHDIDHRAEMRYALIAGVRFSW